MRRWGWVFCLWLGWGLAWAQTGGVSPRVAQALAIVAEAMEAGRDADALARLEVLRERRLRPAERALVERTRGHLLARAERYPEAIAALRAALETGAVTGQALQDLRLDLGQLLLAEGEDEAGLRLLAAWRADGGELTPPLVDWLAYAYYRNGRSEEAAALLDEAFARFAPRRPWYELRAALFMEAEAYEAAVRLLQAGLARFPQSAFLWRQLAAAQLRLERPGEALSALETARLQGLLPAGDLVLVARLYGQVGAPYHGARILEEALRRGEVGAEAGHWGLVAEYLLQARERDAALAAFQRASHLAEDGHWDLRRGELLLEIGQWQAARAALDRALARGVKDTVRARYLLGVALAESGEAAPAQAQFREVLSDPRLGPYARQWLQRLARQG